MRYASFVIRLWQPEVNHDPPGSAWHGRIEHVQTGAAAHVTCMDDIAAFIQEQLLTTLSDKQERDHTGADLAPARTRTRDRHS